MAATALPFWAVECLLGAVSLGLGTLMPVATVATQNAVQLHHLGTATAAANFCRQLSGAVIVAVFGAIALSGHGGHAVTLEMLSAGGSPEIAATFRWVFVAASVGLGATLLLLIALEERPLRDRAVSAGPQVE